MKKITSLIRADGEFSGFLTCLAEAYSTGEGLPIAVNGLSGGAESAFLAEAVREGVKLTSRPVLVLVENENEREKTVSLFILHHSFQIFRALITFPGIIYFDSGENIPSIGIFNQISLAISILSWYYINITYRSVKVCLLK